MARDVTEFRCLLVSPSDVEAERKALGELVELWNAQIGKALNARVVLVRWETHSTPDLAGPAQTVLNAQLVDDCDFGLAIFWSRLGTPTPESDSGSIEEIERLAARGARVLVYFCNRPVPQSALRDDQFQRLMTFKSQLAQTGLLGEYQEVSDLREQAQLHLTSVISELLQRQRGRAPETSTQLPMPDVRVRTTYGFLVYEQPFRTEGVLSVTVENHSSQTVVLQQVYFPLKDGASLYPPRDYATGRPQARHALPPGDSYSFHTQPSSLIERVQPDQIKCAAVKDAIGRTFESDENEFQAVLKAAVSRSERDGPADRANPASKK